MSLKLSFILPCYNVERYVSDCLGSIYAQDLPEDEYEVICVNDCSTDWTRTIITEFADIHQNLKLIDHSENLTVGGARTTGIKSAEGEYIWFVDPDDIIKHDCAKTLYEYTKNNELDVLFFNHIVVNENLNLIREDKTFTDSDICNGQEYVVKYFPDRFSSLAIVWRSLIRTAFLRENAIDFPHISRSEDACFMWKVMITAERVASVAGVYYYYRVNPGSSGINRTDASVVVSETILFANEIRDLLDNYDEKLKSVVRCDLKRALTWSANNNLKRLIPMSEQQRLCYYNLIVSNMEIINRLKPYMNRKNRLLFSLLGWRWIWQQKLYLLMRQEKQKKH